MPYKNGSQTVEMAIPITILRYYNNKNNKKCIVKTKSDIRKERREEEDKTEQDKEEEKAGAKKSGKFNRIENSVQSKMNTNLKANEQTFRRWNVSEIESAFWNKLNYGRTYPFQCVWYGSCDLFKCSGFFFCFGRSRKQMEIRW